MKELFELSIGTVLWVAALVATGFVAYSITWLFMTGWNLVPFA